MIIFLVFLLLLAVFALGVSVGLNAAEKPSLDAAHDPYADALAAAAELQAQGFVAAHQIERLHQEPGDASR